MFFSVLSEIFPLLRRTEGDIVIYTILEDAMAWK